MGSMPAKKTIDYKALSAELDAVVGKLEHTDTDVDEAMRLYERGRVIVSQLEAYIKDAENKIIKVKQSFEN